MKSQLNLLGLILQISLTGGAPCYRKTTKIAKFNKKLTKGSITTFTTLHEVLHKVESSIESLIRGKKD